MATSKIVKTPRQATKKKAASTAAAATITEQVPASVKASRIFTPQIILVLSVLIVIAQGLLISNPVLGLYGFVVGLIMASFIAVRHTELRVVAMSIAAIPVAYLVSFALPQHDTVSHSLLFYNTLLLQALGYRYLFAKDKVLVPMNISLKDFLRLLPTFVILGQIFGIILFFLLRHNSGTETIGMPLLITTAGIIAISQELLFRGLIQQSVWQATNPAFASFIAAILYVSIALPTHSIPTVIASAIIGIVLSDLYAFKPHIALTTAANFIGQVLMLGLLTVFN